MVFNSIQFMLFFPIVALIYFIMPNKIKYIWLLISSYYFYMCWNPKYILLIGTSTIITYLCSILIESSNKIQEGKKRNNLKKMWLALSIISNLGILVFFKYYNFATHNITNIFNYLNISVTLPNFDIILPVGISFYTFQVLGYTIDVYRGNVYAEKNIAKYALFVSFFPQLVAGPIGRAKDLLVSISEPRTFNYERVKNGMLMIIWGLFQKMVVADRIGILVNEVYKNYENYSGLQIVVATIFFGVQIYCDFASCSNIAIGVARVFGYNLMKNFDRPYFACSISDFWRRWHISLTSWFRDYLYIPLGGNRYGKLRKYINIMIIFITSGLWHGASWNFIIWGVLHGFYQVVGDVIKPIRKKVTNYFNINTKCFSYELCQKMITFILVDFAWIFFKAEGTRQSVQIIKRMFSTFNIWIFFDGSIYKLGLDEKNFQLALICMIIVFFVDYIQGKMDIKTKLAEQNLLFRWSVYFVAIFSVIILGIYGIGYSAGNFIYAQF